MSGVQLGAQGVVEETYHLAAIVETARQVQPSSDGLAAVWLEHDAPAADYLRAEEARVFPEVPGLLTTEVEEQCMFLAIVDTEAGRVLHATRFSAPSIRRASGAADSGSGFVLVDELIEESDTFTVEVFKSRYDGPTLERSFAIETNFRIGEKVTLRSGVRVAHLGYLALFRLVERHRPRGAESFVFGAQNEVAVRSVSALGIPAHPLSGFPAQRNDPERVYRPMVFSVTDATRAVFDALESIALPETWVAAPEWARDVLALPQVVAQRQG
jgi:hypothetical protein